MKLKHLLPLLLSLNIAACATDSGQGRISELDKVKLDIKDVDVKGGLDKAMAGYQKFLSETPESQLTPEAIRRLADLKIEKEYGTVTENATPATGGKAAAAPEASAPVVAATKQEDKPAGKPLDKKSAIADLSESEKAFEKRATRTESIKSTQAKTPIPAGVAGADLKNANAEQAIALYKKLLAKYPMYERNDQVLYQLSRAYEETGDVDAAMKVMNQLIKQYPKSRYIDEVQFRRGEYYFTRKKYLDAEEAYAAVLSFGVGSVYYSHALFKKGWTFYKEQMYEEALDEFIKLLDYQVSIGYDFDQTKNEIEKKRSDDTFRVISLAFSNLGGAQTVQDFFKKIGPRSYEDNVYSHLAEFYFGKRRYSDAASTYNAFVERNPYNKKSPYFSMRVIEIYKKGNFPRLVIESKKKYATDYGVKAAYWKYFSQSEYPQVLENVKINIFDLAQYYHSLYQNKKFAKDKPTNFTEASHWYREYLASFPKDKKGPDINYQLADLLFENRNFNQAAREYERTAYDYPLNDKSSKAAYAAVYAYRQHLKDVAQVQQFAVKRDIIRSSIRLVDKFPHHEKATIVLGAAVDDLFEMHEYAAAIQNGRRLIKDYPGADPAIRRGAWLVVAHSSFQLENYADAEAGYTEVLALTAKTDNSRVKLVDNLAASIYKQGEQARAKEDYKNAVRHFLRIAKVAPNSAIRITAEYDAAAVLIQVMDLSRAAEVLLAFRNNYPGNKLQHDVTKKIAYVYKEMQRYTAAGKEYERVAAEAKDEEVVREAMLAAADMYTQAKDTDNSLRVYKQFVARFPKPLEFALETYYKIAMLYKDRNDLNSYHSTLQNIITRDAQAGSERTDRTRYLAAEASLVIIEPQYDRFVAMKLVTPLKQSVKRKETAMKQLIKSYGDLVNYKVADVTAAATYYLAEIYYNFNRSLLASEIPKGLSAVELEEFKLALEDQAYPFEEKAIKVHEKNVELLHVGVYSKWIDRSIEKLASLVPARFAKFEEISSYIADMEHYSYTPPSLVREEAASILVENLTVFRYSSQKLDASPIDRAPAAEIGTMRGQTGAQRVAGDGQNGAKAAASEAGKQPDSTESKAPAADTPPAAGSGQASEPAAAPTTAPGTQDAPALLGPPDTGGE